jgi:hypothetical protein
VEITRLRRGGSERFEPSPCEGLLDEHLVGTALAGKDLPDDLRSDGDDAKQLP